MPKILFYKPPSKTDNGTVIFEEDPIERVRSLFPDKEWDSLPEKALCPKRISKSEMTKIIKEENKFISSINGNFINKCEDHRDNYNDPFNNPFSALKDQKEPDEIKIKPKAAFIKAFVKLIFKTERVQTPVVQTDMLVDTGCMISTMSTSFYNQINNNSTAVRLSLIHI